MHVYDCLGIIQLSPLHTLQGCY